MDLFQVVLIAFFDDVMEAREHPVGSGKKNSVIPNDKFFDKLYSLKVRSSKKQVHDLSSFLAYQNDTDCIDVKLLASATGEYVRNQYFKQFGEGKI